MRRAGVVVAVLLAATLVVAPAETYTAANVDRTGGVDVASDRDAVVGLQGPDTAGDPTGGTLVTLRNGFDESRTFTLTLDNRTGIYDLSAPGDTDGRANAVTVTVPRNGRVQVTYDCQLGGGFGQFLCAVLGDDVAFGVSTEGRLLSASLSRVRAVGLLLPGVAA